MQFKNAITKPVVRHPINLSEFFFMIFQMFMKKKMGGRITNFREIEKN